MSSRSHQNANNKDLHNYCQEVIHQQIIPNVFNRHRTSERDNLTPRRPPLRDKTQSDKYQLLLKSENPIKHRIMDPTNVTSKDASQTSNKPMNPGDAVIDHAPLQMSRSDPMKSLEDPSHIPVDHPRGLQPSISDSVVETGIYPSGMDPISTEELNQMLTHKLNLITPDIPVVEGAQLPVNVAGGMLDQEEKKAGNEVGHASGKGDNASLVIPPDATIESKSNLMSMNEPGGDSTKVPEEMDNASSKIDDSSPSGNREKEKEEKKVETFAEGFPKKYEVLIQAKVREDKSFDSPHITDLPEGTSVTVAEIQGRRARIIKPIHGWLSVKTKMNGKILLPLDGNHTKVGCELLIRDDKNDMSYSGKIMDYDESKKKHKVLLQDGKEVYIDIKQKNVKVFMSQSAQAAKNKLSGDARVFDPDVGQRGHNNLALFHKVFARDYPQFVEQERQHAAARQRHMASHTTPMDPRAHPHGVMPGMMPHGRSSRLRERMENGMPIPRGPDDSQNGVNPYMRVQSQNGRPGEHHPGVGPMGYMGHSHRIRRENYGREHGRETSKDRYYVTPGMVEKYAHMKEMARQGRVSDRAYLKHYYSRHAAAKPEEKQRRKVCGLIVLRGLPGSGKTTLARKLAARAQNAKICTEDKYHWSGGEDGVGNYKFKPELVFLAREWCTKEIRYCIKKRINLIILDNHNARISMYEDHIQYAVKYGYRFRIIEFVASEDLIDKYRARSYKKFPREVYVKLLKLWEKDPRAELVNPAFDDKSPNKSLSDPSSKQGEPSIENKKEKDKPQAQPEGLEKPMKAMAPETNISGSDGEVMEHDVPYSPPNPHYNRMERPPHPYPGSLSPNQVRGMSRSRHHEQASRHLADAHPHRSPHMPSSQRASHQMHPGRSRMDPRVQHPHYPMSQHGQPPQPGIRYGYPPEQIPPAYQDRPIFQ